MKVITVSHHEIESLIDSLIDKIDFQPDMIVGVLNGGKFILDRFRQSDKFRKSEFLEIKLQRKTESIKSNKVVAKIMKILPYFVLNMLRILESNRVKANIKSIDFSLLDGRSLDLSFINTEFSRILIVDDALDSGKTLYVIKKQLQEKLPLVNIKSAVIAWTIDQSIVQPDYYVFKNTLVRYPWSKDFKS